MIFGGLLALPLLASAQSAQITQGSGEAKTRADACVVATRSAMAGKPGFLESQGRLEKVEKKCDCDQTKNGWWSCMASVAYVEKK